MRAGSRGRLIAIPSFFGIMCQLCTFGVVMPIYVTLHLFTSPASFNPNRENTDFPFFRVNTFLWSISNGYILPTILMAFPNMSKGLLPSKQHAIAFWQPWPIYISLIQYVLSKFSIICSCFGPQSNNITSRQTKTRNGLRRIYAFAFSCAAIPHLASWTISLAAWVFPTLFSPKTASTLAPRNVFVNQFPWSSARPESLGVGTLWFLQWDHLIGAIVALVWTAILYAAAHIECRIPISGFKLMLKVVTFCVVAGIAGAAVELMWERDELLLDLQDAKRDKTFKSQ
ncbi:hypothetical protein CISG_05043 [Coccidioides immitis RMSCC 3703]|uniref:Uncharacterized protein n=2 Tax=Coccidioides immitis TaxID=5501 RepID=A0A0J8QVR2_COCIT|nr:hypothetical protein CIRG_01444 [Coccidioides immitis RMSCC 2394]KMU75408.1 hypothetical protein CISG_05043 [Coccidioides immitis RMSCC 3703]